MAAQVVNDLVCDTCQKEFESKSKLDRHKANKNGCKIKSDDFMCINCDKRFCNKYTLIRHQKKCLNELQENEVQEQQPVNNDKNDLLEEIIIDMSSNPKLLTKFVKYLLVEK